jgi:uncharacterized protein (TIGR03437 family)
MRINLLLVLLAAIPFLAKAESVTPSIRFTGAPIDGGHDCSSCHNSFGPALSNTSALTTSIGSYNPGVEQIIQVFIQNPTAKLWGFQMTIREVSNQTLSAGVFGQPTGPVQVRCDDGSQFGSTPPCNQLTQFAEHLNAPQTVAGAGFEFDVPWIPPTSDVGALQVYISAVAADGDKTPLGDHVYTYSQTILSTGACTLGPKPVVRAGVNGASFQAPFSSNAMMSIFGTNLNATGVMRSVGLGDFVNNAFPTELACVSVEMSGPALPNGPVLAPITYVQSDQINVQAPEFTGTGTVNVVVIVNPGQSSEQRSDPATLTTLQPFAPAFFLFANSMSIAAEFAGTANLVADPSVIPLATPAHPGDIVTLYGTGFGDTNPSVAAGQLDSGVAGLTNQITVSISGVTLASSDVLYAGLSPGSLSGLYQFNVRVPATVPTGDVPVVITIGGVQTQAGATIPVQ